jgi:hypothetical protein
MMRRASWWGALASWALVNVDASAGAVETLGKAIAESKPVLDLRLRMELVEQQPFAHDASAVTLRSRIGFETGKAWQTRLLAEGVANVPLQQHFNSTSNGRTRYPVVADPENYALNRLQLVNSTLPHTTITVGRQRLNLDDQRFVGSVGWRQNEQTLDGVRLVTGPWRKVTLDLTYADQVNRVFGRDGAPGPNTGRFHGSNWLANVSWQTALGKLSAFGYLVDIHERPQPVLDSTSTYGLRLAGTRPVGIVHVSYVLSHAWQQDHADNPLAFHNDYWLAESTVALKEYSLGAGLETLQGDGTKGFTTPLGTLHKFQGWADKFLTTPPNGLQDVYAQAGYQRKSVGVLDTLGVSLVWHRYDSQRASIDYGSELDLLLQATHGRWAGQLKYADYQASAGTPQALRDTRKLWAQVEFAW